MIHELPLGAAPLHGHFSRDLAPVLEIEPGDSVRFGLPNSAWLLGPGEPFDRTDPELDTGHAMVGPLEVRGAFAGQVLSVRIDEVVAGGWGENFGGAGRHLEWELRDGFGHAVGRSSVSRRSSACSACRHPSPEPTPRDRPDAGAATSTARSSWRGRRSSCRSQ